MDFNFHNIVTHAPIVYRVVATHSILAEQDESTIWRLRQLTSHTSSGRPSEILENALMRTSYLHMTASPSTCQSDNIVAREAHSVKLMGRTFIPNKCINGTSASDVRAHYMRISDYLCHGEGLWFAKSDRGVVIFDNAASPDNRTEVGFNWMKIPTFA